MGLKLSMFCDTSDRLDDSQKRPIRGKNLPLREVNDGRCNAWPNSERLDGHAWHESNAYVEEPQLPPPQRLPAWIAALAKPSAVAHGNLQKAYLIAAVSSVTPSPFAPKSWHAC